MEELGTDKHIEKQSTSGYVLEKTGKIIEYIKNNPKEIDNNTKREGAERVVSLCLKTATNLFHESVCLHFAHVSDCNRAMRIKTHRSPTDIKTEAEDLMSYGKKLAGLLGISFEDNEELDRLHNLYSDDKPNIDMDLMDLFTEEA